MDYKFSPQLDILPHGQLFLWDELIDIPEQFTLYGGTAVALHLGHRESIDFDFFSNEGLNIDRLLTDIPFMSDARVIQREPEALSVIVDRGNRVKVSFFGHLNLKQIEEPLISEDNDLKIASLRDLAATKVKVIQDRGEAKDYIDIYHLSKNGLALEEALAGARHVYGRQFNALSSLKALAYFGDGDLKTLSPEIKQHLSKISSEIDLQKLSALEKEVTQTRRPTQDRS